MQQGKQLFNSLSISVVLTTAIVVLSLSLFLAFGNDELNLLKFVLSGTDHLPGHLQESAQIILWEIRLPRMAAAILCGICLAAAGTVTQLLLRNPLASPSIMGVNGMAAFIMAAMSYFAPERLNAASQFWMIGAASIFTWIIYASIIKVWRFTDATGILLLGFCFNVLFSALNSIIITTNLDDHQQTAALLHWLMGGLREHDPSILLGCLGIAAPLILFTFFKLLPAFYLLNLGEDHARAGGIKLSRLYNHSVFVVVVLTAISCSLAGPIAFVGLIIPHVTRIMVGFNLKAGFLLALPLGASLLLMGDAIGRELFFPREMQVGIFTALLGSMVFIGIAVSQWKQSQK